MRVYICIIYIGVSGEWGHIVVFMYSTDGSNGNNNNNELAHDWNIYIPSLLI